MPLDELNQPQHLRGGLDPQPGAALPEDLEGSAALSSMKMSGGTVTGNSAADGGGVRKYDNGVFS